MKTSARTQALAGLLLLTLAAAGCENIASATRQVTYPRDFQYVSEEELRSDMQRMAFQLQRLDTALAAAPAGESAQQDRVLEILDELRDVTSGLRTRGIGTNHPFLEDFMLDFRSDLQQARNSAARMPPSYYYAGRLAGGCMNCHRANR